MRSVTLEEAVSSARKPILAIVAAVSLATGGGALAAGGDNHRQGLPVGACTMAVPAIHATVEAEIADASDFCELVSQALAVDVFRASVVVTPGGLWHYADAALSCRLGYANRSYQMTVRNSALACRWLANLAGAWHRETSAPAYAT